MHLWQECKEGFEVEAAAVDPRLSEIRGCQDVHWARVTRQEIEQVLGFLKSNRWICFQLLLRWKYDARSMFGLCINSIWRTALILPSRWLRWVNESCSQLELNFAHFGLAWAEGFARAGLLLNLLFQGSWCSRNVFRNLIFELVNSDRMCKWRDFWAILGSLVSFRINKVRIYERKCEKGAKLYVNW